MESIPMDYYSSVGATLVTHEGRDAFVRMHINHGWARHVFQKLVKRRFNQHYESLLMHAWQCVNSLDSQYGQCRPNLIRRTITIHEHNRKRDRDLMSLLIHSWWCLTNMDHSHTRIAKRNSALAAHVNTMWRTQFLEWIESVDGWGFANRCPICHRPNEKLLVL